MLEARDFETNQVLDSLNGYVSPICGKPLNSNAETLLPISSTASTS